MQPVTVAALKRSSQILELGCLKCGHTIYRNPETLPLPDDEAVPNIARRLRCSRCNAGGEYCHSRPDARIDQNPAFKECGSSGIKLLGDNA